MNFEELIEKLKKEHGNNGTYEVLKMWYKELKRTNNNFYYYKISGFLWGLYATEFINDNEREELINNINNIDVEKSSQ